MSAERWPRDAYRAAVWESKLRPLERLVALAFAEHARHKAYAAVTYPRLMECTGMSRDAVARALTGLRAAGWLVEKEAARQQRATRYWLQIPDGQQSASRTAEQDQQSVSQTAGYPHASASRTADDLSSTPDGLLADSSSPSPVTSSPPDGPDQSVDHSEDQSIDAHESSPEPASSADDPVAAVPVEHRAAVLELVSRLAPGITSDDAADCVAWVAARKRPDNLAGYVSRFPVADVIAKAALWRDQQAGTAPDTTKCTHGIRNGMDVLGRGKNASRRCDRCEQDSPADDAVHVRADDTDRRASA